MPNLENVLELQEMLAEFTKRGDEKFHADFYEDIDRFASTTIRNLTRVAPGNFLHNLFQNQATDDEVMEIVASYPHALRALNRAGRTPIQQAARKRSSYQYVRLLAEGGLKYNPDGRCTRGGLLEKDPHSESGLNILQLLANLKSNCTSPPSNPPLESTDSMLRRIMIDLREADLLLKKDIVKYNLLYYSCHIGAKLRFKYLVSWDPEALKQSKYRGEPLLHAVIKLTKLPNRPVNIDSFSSILNSWKLYFFEEMLDPLFERNTDGETACECAFKHFGKQNTLDALKKLIPADTKFLILHHVIAEVPQYVHDFMEICPAATSLRDEKGRTAAQFALAYGYKTAKKDALFFEAMSQKEIEEKDAETNLYQFMVAAASDIKVIKDEHELSVDLNTIWYLLGRNPAVLGGHSQDTHGEPQKMRPRRKSNREKRNEDIVVFSEVDSKCSCSIMQKDNLVKLMFTLLVKEALVASTFKMQKFDQMKFIVRFDIKLQSHFVQAVVIQLSAQQNYKFL